jgi:hypothetical protein
MKTNGNRRQSTAQRQASNSPTEGVLDRLFIWLDISLVRQTAGELARECYAALGEATFERAIEMSRDEAREYIKALAPEFLACEVDPVLQRRRVRESLRLKIMAEATEQVVELVLKELQRAKSRRVSARAA